MSNKLTMHSGRAHSDGKTFDPKHNDRKFNVAHADNIIMAKLKHERYWNCVDKQFYGYYDKGYTSFADARNFFRTSSQEVPWNEQNLNIFCQKSLRETL